MGNNTSKKNQIKYIELTKQELDQLKFKTKFSEAEIRQWHAGFYRDCPNGELRYKKLLEIFKEFYVQDKRAEIFCKYVFGMLHKKEDGMITFDEFLLGISSTHQGDLNMRLELVFDMYDVSGNGFIDEKELSQMISAMYNLIEETARDPKKTARDIIKKFDQTPNKKLSKEEFIDACKKDKRLIKMLGPKSKEDFKTTEKPPSSKDENDDKNNDNDNENL